MSKKLKQLENIRILWHLNYYDGPQSGVALYNDNLVYFDLFEEAEPKEVTVEEDGEKFEELDWGWYRKFRVYELTNDDKIRLITTHALWQGHMGLHTDYFPWDARRARCSNLKTGESQVPILHYGSAGHRDAAWNDYQVHKNKFEEKHGSFEVVNAKPIGWIYYDQLFSQRKDDKVSSD
jgi:hypothetical protein